MAQFSNNHLLPERDIRRSCIDKFSLIWNFEVLKMISSVYVNKSLYPTSNVPIPEILLVKKNPRTLDNDEFTSHV